MEKKITSVKIKNYRAYCDEYDILQLPQGENALIYGENGSGKSSLYKALNSYLNSSNNNTVPFVKNRYQDNLEGEIRIKFAEYDGTTFEIINGTETEYFFGSIGSNHNIPFIQTASLIKGFLDYTDLLKVYFHKEPTPNLFDLIILSLLGDHIPVGTGGNFKFRIKWLQLQKDLTVNAYTRNDNCHYIALKELPVYEVHLRGTLNQVFIELNRLLSVYFPQLNIQLAYILQPLTFDYMNDRKWLWHTHADFRLQVIKDGIPISGDYSDFLNEARLSAIAICIYLASLLRNPTAVDLRVLYLDDVFIGLDASNRMPILNILRNEFAGYQKFVSTYDRHWFEMAKRHFEIYNDKSWTTIEIYEGRGEINGVEITKPIVVRGQSNYEKAVKYLHDNTNPDYPAAANYFRKALEELIPEFIPDYELVDTDNSQLPHFKLTTLLTRAKNFLLKTNNNTDEISKIIGLLHNLLHPLSHHEISAPIYKSELLILETSIALFKSQLIALDISSNYKCGLEGGNKLKVNFIVDVTKNYYCTYEIHLKEPIVLQYDLAGAVVISLSRCYTTKCYGSKEGAPLSAYNPDKNNPLFNYISLENSFDIIHNYLVGYTGINFPKPTNFLNEFDYHNGKNWEPLSSKLVW